MILCRYRFMRGKDACEDCKLKSMTKMVVSRSLQMGKDKQCKTNVEPIKCFLISSNNYLHTHN